MAEPIPNASPPPSGPNRPSLSTLSEVAPITPNRPPPPTPEQIAAFNHGRLSRSAQAVQAGRDMVEAALSLSPEPLPFVQPPVIAGAPPARVALMAGVHDVRPDYDPGRRGGQSAPMMVVPVMPRADDSAAPAMAEGVMLRPAREMDEGSANTALNAIIARSMTWMANYPYEVTGEAAETLAYYRKLASRRMARLDAATYGQENESETEARYLPPPEALVLRRVRQEIATVLFLYGRVLAAGGLMLTDDDQRMVDNLRQTLDIS